MKIVETSISAKTHPILIRGKECSNLNIIYVKNIDIPLSQRYVLPYRYGNILPCSTSESSSWCKIWNCLRFYGRKPALLQPQQKPGRHSRQRCIDRAKCVSLCRGHQLGAPSFYRCTLVVGRSRYLLFLYTFEGYPQTSSILVSLLVLSFLYVALTHRDRYAESLK